MQLPFELVVVATPVSRQARRHEKRSAWRDEILAAALAELASDVDPVTQPVVLRIGYFYRGGSLDLDNIINSIQNGLEGVVFANDGQVTDLIEQEAAGRNVSRRESVAEACGRFDERCRFPAHFRRLRTRHRGIAMTLTDLKRTKLDEIAAEYRSRGYVVAYSGEAELPDFLREFTPDLTATGNGEHVVVAVRASPELRSEDLARLAKAISQRSDWRLDLAVVNPAASDEIPVYGELASEQVITDLLGNAEELRRDGQTEAAAMLVWSAAEAVLRRMTRDESDERKASSYVLKSLYADGLLEPSMYTSLERMLEFRNAFAHGFGARLEPGIVDEVIADVRRLRDQQAA